MESLLPPREPQVVKAVVNGLIATVILWTFWTPFIIFLAVPLVNNQLKEGVCYGLFYGLNGQSVEGAAVSSVKGWIEFNIILPLLNSKIITKRQAQQFSELLGNFIPPPNPANPSAQNIINQDPTEIKNDNWSLTAVMTMLCLLISFACITLAVHLTQMQNLDGWAIVRFNLVMALVIMIIEMGFFAGVATEQMPFNPTSIAQDVGSQAVNYMNTISSS